MWVGIVAIVIATMLRASEAAEIIKIAVELDKKQKKEDEVEEERRRRDSSTIGRVRRTSSTLGLSLLNLHHGATFCKKGAIFPTDT